MIWDISNVLKFWPIVELQELQLDEFVTHEVEFKDINKAFDLLSKGQCLRCVIWMDKWMHSYVIPYSLFGYSDLIKTVLKISLEIKKSLLSSQSTTTLEHLHC